MPNTCYLKSCMQLLPRQNMKRTKLLLRFFIFYFLVGVCFPSTCLIFFFFPNLNFKLFKKKNDESEHLK